MSEILEIISNERQTDAPNFHKFSLPKGSVCRLLLLLKMTPQQGQAIYHDHTGQRPVKGKAGDGRGKRNENKHDK